MNKVVTVNLAGTAYQIEDAGYEALHAYLETARQRLNGNPDRDEILSDIERAIGEKFAARLSAHKNVVLEKEVREVIEQMGEIQNDAAGAAGEDSAKNSGAAGAPDQAGGSAGPRRLYRILEGRQLSGVCVGLGAYFNIDPTLFRLAFVLMTLLWGTGIIVYLVLHIMMPVARTPEQKAEATGAPTTAQEFIRRAKKGYYDAVKAFPDEEARRQWRREFKKGMREWRSSLPYRMKNCATDWAAHPGAGVALPLFSLIHGALVVLWICALITLFSSGTILGVALPAGLPVWVAAIVLMICYGLISWPLKAARQAFYFGGPAAGAPFALFCLIDACIWIAVVGVLFWLAVHYLPQARDALHNIPSVIHEMIDSVRNWWHRR